MTLKEAYEYGKKKLSETHISDADLDAWYLLEYVTGISRAEYFMDMMRTLKQNQEMLYREYIKIRAAHTPLQHITGVQEFMGLEFCVNEQVLVPRQDTEVLVEQVLQDLKQCGEKNRKILDMCTGSGCILLSIVKLCKECDITGVGVDLSEAALDVAKRNAEKQHADVLLLQSDLFEQVEESFDIIVSNPPYIPTKVIDELEEEVKLHDPYLALDGKEDGLYFYRRIVEESPKYLNKGGKLYFEIGHDQGEAVSMLMKQAGFKAVTVKKDLAGLDRVVFGVYNV